MYASCNAGLLVFISIQFNLVVYNPLGRAYQWYLRFPVNTPAITVTGPTGTLLPVQVIVFSVDDKRRLY